MQIHDAKVSGEHALVCWNGEHWEAKDLNSTNGTTVDGQKLERGDRVPLHEGSELRFAGDPWVLASALPPCASARSESGQQRIAEEGLLILPDSTTSIACAYEDGDGLWWIEVGDDARLAQDQETILAGEPWVLSIPPVPTGMVAQTERIGDTTLLSSLSLRFGVSANEEYVELTLLRDDRPFKKSARAFHYILLTLARARIDDRERGMPRSDQGWLYVDELLRMLRTEAEHLNVGICRARKELAGFGIADAGTIVERRATTRQVRLGTDKVEIVKV